MEPEKNVPSLARQLTRNHRAGESSTALRTTALRGHPLLLQDCAAALRPNQTSKQQRKLLLHVKIQHPIVNYLYIIIIIIIIIN